MSRRIVIAGGHGKIALILARLLADRGDSPVGLIRNPDHVRDVEDTGARAVVIDLEKATVDELAEHLRDVDAVVFAAGAGPGSGAERKDTVDRGAAVLLADAAVAAGVRRYVMISAMGADAEVDSEQDEVFAAYLRAKSAADADVRSRSELDSTIVRPGGLTDDPATSMVTVAESTGRGSIPRADVASVVVSALDIERTVGQTFEVIGGDTPIDVALTAL